MLEVQPTSSSSRHPPDELTRVTRLVLLAAIGYLVFATFKPFFSALLWASILSYGLYPLYRRLLGVTGGRSGLSAFLMSVGVTVGLVLPFLWLSVLIGKEVARTYMGLVAGIDQGLGLLERWQGHPIVAGVTEQLQEFERVTGTDFRAVIASNLSELGRTLVQRLTELARDVFGTLIDLGIILLSTFYFFRDGHALGRWARERLPIPGDRQQLVLRRFGEVVRGTVYGNTVVAVLEGVIGGLAFWLVGLPAALLWGSVMAVLAYLPLVGAGLVWGPAAIYLFFQGAYAKMAVMIVAGVIVALLDYIVRTVLVSGASNLHTLLTFFAVLGGIQLFGLVGLVAGPLVVAVGIALLESYRVAEDQPGIPPGG